MKKITELLVLTAISAVDLSVIICIAACDVARRARWTKKQEGM
jgi:hypothetical protein